jgi:hypothetical protein
MNPSSTTITCNNGFEWPAYTPESGAVAVFDEEITLGDASTIPDGPQS